MIEHELPEHHVGLSREELVSRCLKLTIQNAKMKHAGDALRSLALKNGLDGKQIAVWEMVTKKDKK